MSKPTTMVGVVEGIRISEDRRCLELAGKAHGYAFVLTEEQVGEIVQGLAPAGAATVRETVLEVRWGPDPATGRNEVSFKTATGLYRFLVSPDIPITAEHGDLARLTQESAKLTEENAKLQQAEEKAWSACEAAWWDEIQAKERIRRLEALIADRALAEANL